MVKLSSIIKGIILYTLFVIGISILSQYLGKNGKGNQLDYLLDSIKDQIKNEYLNKIENFTTLQPQPRHHLGYQSNYPITEEEQILQEVNKRLQMSSMTLDNSYHPLATTSDFSFQNTEYPWQRGVTNTGPVQTFQKYTQYPIDNYNYTPNPNNQFLPQKLGFQNGQFRK